MSPSRIVIIAAVVVGAFLLGRLSTSTNRLRSKLAVGQKINLVQKDSGFAIAIATPENRKAALMGSRWTATVTAIGSDYFEVVSKMGKDQDSSIIKSIPFRSIDSITVYEIATKANEVTAVNAKPSKATATVEQHSQVYGDALHGNASQPN